MDSFSTEEDMTMSGYVSCALRHRPQAVLAAHIHPKSGCPGCPDSAKNSNFPQKDCLRSRKLSVSVPES